jgi:hypothetical protein
MYTNLQCGTHHTKLCRQNRCLTSSGEGSEIKFPLQRQISSDNRSLWSSKRKWPKLRSGRYPEEEKGTLVNEGLIGSS